MRRALGPGTADEGRLLVVAVSGGADSVALAAGVAFEAGDRSRLVTVDHGLQPGSDVVARGVLALAERLGLPGQVLTVEVGRVGGPENAARLARRAALLGVAGGDHGAHDGADGGGAPVVLLAHTLDDQAETVLLGLARGSGARSLAGMRAADGRWRRPLLGLERATTRAACAEQGLPVHHDPHNDDPSYTRVRVRHQVLPVLAEALGPGVPQALARTADLLRDDADLLDGLTRSALPGCLLDPVDAELLALGVTAVAALHPALRGRVLHVALVAAGIAPGSLARVHVDALERLVTHWRGQGAVGLPGGCSAVRRHDRLSVLGPDAGPGDRAARGDQ